jgi:cytochrome c biogenesis protein CcmG, thiol:disulfide interchange protein DsbE
MKKRPALYTTIGLAIVLGALVVTLATRDSALDRVADSPLLGKPAPALAGASMVADGQTFDLGDQEGRYVLVNFFATWCEPCKAEHDDLVQFSEVHSATDDARVVSVVFRGDDPEAVQSFFGSRGGGWPVIQDPGGAIATSWGAIKVPESYLVDPNGYVVSKIIGGIDYSRLEELLQRAQQAA